MRLTSFTNYALRSLQLAALRDPALVRVDEVARIHRLSRSHVVKIVHELGKANLLETFRGRNGGFRLARPAEEITVGEVVRLTEGPFHVVECLDPATNSCALIGACRLTGLFHRATSAFLGELDKMTIAEIAGNRDALMARIGPLSETDEAPAQMGGN